MRLDKALIERGLAETRSRAVTWIKEGKVLVNDAPVTTASAKTKDTDKIELSSLEHQWVSRGAFKLLAALEVFDVDLANKTCIDLGVSTGGFSEVLLQQGVARIYGVDVGHGQVHPRVANDERMVVLEQTNARYLDAEQVPDPVDVVVSDLSFISLKIALPAGLDLLVPGGHLVALIKPQFEVGKGNLGKNGVVKDPEQHQSVCDDISAFIVTQGFTVQGLCDSPVLGPKGNKEFLIHATKNP